VAQAPFAAALNYTVGTAPLSVFSADFNRDGNMDLATANATSVNNVSVILGNGTGTFCSSSELCGSRRSYPLYFQRILMEMEIWT
jgi:hypothetical protein